MVKRAVLPKRSSMKEGAAVAELALKAHVWGSNCEILADSGCLEADGKRPSAPQVMSFLGPLGYEQLQVTNRGADRGIDGFGLFRQGVVTIRSAFQAKRWRQNAVSRPEIDKFRGAIQGDYDHGVFLTTGRFTADAEAASIKKGAISLLLLDGDAIAESMIRNGIGVVRRPVQLFDLDPEFFRFPAADRFL